MSSSPARMDERDPNELFWVENQPYLFSVGYKLRPRYHPDWTPTWQIDPTKSQLYAEDDLEQWKYTVLDAVRMKDNKKVVLKRVETGSLELQMLQLLDSETMRKDPRNRTVPLLDTISLPHNPGTVLMVMMYGRRFHYPPFHCREELFDALSQLLQGMEFMHEHNIVHGDAAIQNIIMDETRVVPKGSHFLAERTHSGHSRLFSWKNRCSVAPVNYYYIDFGLTFHFPAGVNDATMVGYYGSWRKPIPELSATVPYNPFKVDVCRLGLTILRVIAPYPALADFAPLGNRMCDPDSSQRPTPTEALVDLSELKASMKPHLLREVIWQTQATSFDRFTRRVLGAYWLDFRSA
ncbi:hypothetical protein B0H15DRAFT_474123 [Mycena belliarum]|uniref:Protein kinase domain-containing protein n=1 Tax=Mycena belliarum TaxID=1033014 RepID=A0AAD6TXJ7_9AGAR|nr:hypothetical protein B0H15DRAFT_474123 [Mycena belliae]